MAVVAIDMCTVFKAPVRPGPRLPDHAGRRHAEDDTAPLRTGCPMHSTEAGSRRRRERPGMPGEHPGQDIPDGHVFIQPRVSMHAAF